MILKTENLSFGFGDDMLFEDVNLQIDEGDKIALLGINGSGKSSFLKLITGEADPVQGRLVVKKNLDLGYQKQFRITNPEISLWIEYENEFAQVQQQLKTGTDIDNEMLAFEKKIRSVLKGLDFDEDDWQRPLKSFSGGEITRISLGKLFMKEYDLLILDEPTNHLDLASVFWLESYLSSYNGTILMVSHDRELVDKVVNRVFEINAKKFWVFNTSYDDYLLQRERMTDTMLKRRKNLEKELDRQKGIVDQYKRWGREKSLKQMHSREKVVEKLSEEVNKIEQMEETEARIGRIPVPDRTEYLVLNVQNLEKSFEDKTDSLKRSRLVFKKISFKMHRGEKAVLLGKNGVGKSTLLNIICGEDKHFSGTFEVGTKVKIGFLTQNLSDLNENSDIFNELSSIVPDWKDYEVRSYAGRFGFVGEDIFKSINFLSGGEKLKLSLAKIILRRPNILILDEPTNHLDLESIEKLEEVLKDFSGAILMVTHDRRLLKKVSNKLLLLTKNKILPVETVEAYFEESKNNSPFRKNSKSTEKPLLVEDYTLKKTLKNRLKAISSALEETEKRFSDLEDEYDKNDKVLYNSSDIKKVQEISKRQEAINEEFEKLIDKMDKLTDEAVATRNTLFKESIEVELN